MSDSPNPGWRRAGDITVSGFGSVPVEANMAALSVTIRWQDSTLAGARSTVSTKATAARDHLLAAGVQPADLQTAQLSVHTIRHDNGPRPGRTVYTEFQVSTTLSAVIRSDIELAQGAVDGLFDVVGEGLELHGLSFDCEDRSGAAAEARRLAFEDARVKASHLAELAGVELGRVRSIREGDAHNAPVVPGRRAMAMAEMAPMPIEGGGLNETVVLQVRWTVGTR